MNGGYLIVSKTDTDLYEKLNKALTLGKPVLWYEDENTCYYVDNISKDGTDIILTIGGNMIIIDNTNNVTINGFNFIKQSNVEWTPLYVGASKNNDKVTFIICGTYTYKTGDTSFSIGELAIPKNIMDKLVPYTIGLEENYLDNKKILLVNTTTPADKQEVYVDTQKKTTSIEFNFRDVDSVLTNENTYVFRYEITFLLSDNLYNE